MNKFSNRNTNRTYDSEKKNLGRFPKIIPNQNQSAKHQNPSNNLQQRNHLTSLSPHKEEIKNPNVIDNTSLDKLSGLTNNGEITPAVNQATEILPKISDADFRWPTDNFFTNNNDNTTTINDVKRVC